VSHAPGRRTAVTVALNTLAYLLYGPVLLVVNLVLALASGAPGRSSLPDNAGRIEQVAGALPLPAPWWLFLLFPVVMACALAAVWNPSRHYRDSSNKRLVLWASPGPIGALTLLLGGALTLLTGLYYSAGTGTGFGLWTLPVVVSVVVGGAGLARAWATLPGNSGRSARAARRGAKNG
jgi:hypothetical protein